MPDTKNAFVVRSFDLADTDRGYFVGAVIEAMPAGQFTDLEMVGLVREATDDEVKEATAPTAPVLSEPESD